MKFRNFGFMMVLLAMLLYSCKPRELPKEKEVVTITKTVTELKRDTIVKVQADSSFYEALIECQNGKPVILSGGNFGTKVNYVKTISGKNLQPPEVIITEDGKLQVKCDYFENLYKITLKEKQVLQEKLSEKTIVPPPEIVKQPLTWWETFWITFGKICFFAALIYLVYKIPWKSFLKL